jgi:lysophospholipase L1-like esterase
MNYILTTLFLACTLTLKGQDAKPLPWDAEVKKYEAIEKARPGPKQAVVFNGSSSIRLWNLAESFPGWKCINHGIGGSIIPENTALVDRLIFPWEPKIIVFYAGDNDIAKNRPPQQVADDWSAYVKTVRAKLPEVKFVYISIKPSIARWKLWPTIQEANAKIKALCEADKSSKFIDVSPTMLGPDGKPIKELLLDDGLHMRPVGYERWVKLIAPEIEAVAK